MWVIDQTAPEWHYNRKANAPIAGSGGLTLSQAPWIAPRQGCLCLQESEANKAFIKSVDRQLACLDSTTSEVYHERCYPESLSHYMIAVLNNNLNYS